MNLPEYSHLVVFDGGNYATYEQARDVKAAVQTPSCIDALTIQCHSTTGLFDTLEICNAIAEVVGSDQLVFGLVDDDGIFRELSDVIDYIQHSKEAI